MKKTLTLLFITLLAIGGISAQTAKVLTSTSVSAVTVPTQAGMTAAITTQAKAQATIDAKQDAALQAAVMPIDTTGPYQKIRNGKLTVLPDASKATVVQFTTLVEQNTSLQKQVNDQKAVNDKLIIQVNALQAIIDKLKIALQ